jgi:diguanylate cyclase (GGDEF)-like protein/PAS domain S-box-containing protein
MGNNGEIIGSLQQENNRLHQKVTQLTHLLKAIAQERSKPPSPPHAPPSAVPPDVLQAIFDYTEVGIGLLNSTGRYVQTNARWSELLGYTPEEACTMHYHDLLLSDELATHDALLPALLQGEREHDALECQFRCKDGTTFWGRLTMRAVRHQQHTLDVIVVMITDITGYRRTQEALQASNQRLEYLVRELRQHNREIILLNAMSDLLQRCAIEEEAYMVLEQFADYLFVQQSGALYIIDPLTNQMQAVASWGMQSPSNSVSLTPDLCLALQRQSLYYVQSPRTGLCCANLGVVLQFPILCIPLMTRDEQFGVLHLGGGPAHSPHAADHWERLAVMVAEHLALTLANLRLRQRLDMQATHDALTGLFNRRYLNRILEHEHTSIPIGVVMLDVDHFKQFNTDYGHIGGDAVLSTLGTFLEEHIREEDVACRYGGEEFVVLLHGASLDDTCRRAEEFRLGIQRLRVQNGSQTLPAITASLGVASYPQHGSSAWEVIAAADIALGHAKECGRNCVVVAEPRSAARESNHTEDEHIPPAP